MARFGIGPIRFGGGRRVGFTGRVGPFSVSVGGRRKKGWGNFGGSGGSGGSSYGYDHEMTPEERLAMAKSVQVQAYQKREVAFIIGSSRHMNRLIAILVATFGWVNLPRDLRSWSLAAGALILLTLNVLRVYAIGYLRKRDKKLSLLDETERSIHEDPESWYETFKLTDGRRRVNSLSLIALTANLAWAYATEPKPEEPGIVAGIVLGAWTLARLIIFAGETGVGPARFFVNIVRVIVSLFMLFVPLSLIGLAFESGVFVGLIALLVLPVVTFVATYFFWQMTKTAEGREIRMNSVERVQWLRALSKGDAQTMDTLEAAVEARKREAANPAKKENRSLADTSKGAVKALGRGLRKLI